MKKFLTLTLVSIMVISFSACGGNKETASNSSVKTADGQQSQQSNQSQEANTSASKWLSTRTGKYYSQFKDGSMYMEYETEIDGTMTKVVTATKGNKTYLETPVEGEKMVMIINDQIAYVIMHSQKQAMKAKLSDVSKNNIDVVMNEADANLESLNTGKREVEGKTYDSETWSEADGSKTTLCFEGDNLVYIINEFEGKSVTVKILKSSSQVDESLFEIPKGYQIIG